MATDNTIQELEQILKNAKKYVVRGDANIRDIDSSRGYAAVFGEIYAYEVGGTITIGGSGIGNKAQVTTFAVNGNFNLTTPDHTNDHIVIQKAGYYSVTVCMAISSTGGTGYTLSAGVWKNNGGTQYQNVHMSRSLSGGGGDTDSTAVNGICNFDVGDTVEVWVWNETNSNNVIVDDVTLSVVKLETDLPKLASVITTLVNDLKKQKILK